MAGITSNVKMVPIAIPATTTIPIEFRRRGTRAAHERQWEVAANSGRAGHQHRTQPDQSRLAHRLKFAQPASLLLICKFNNQNAILCHQADERHESDLGVDI